MCSSCASSKHLQTRRFLDTLKGYLQDIQRLLVQLHRDANARPAPFVDHTGILRDSKTGRRINGYAGDEEDDDEVVLCEYDSYLSAVAVGTHLLQLGILSLTAQMSSSLGIVSVILIHMSVCMLHLANTTCRLNYFAGKILQMEY